MKSPCFPVALSFALLLAWLAMASPTLAASWAQEAGVKPPDALAGAASYAQNCAPCHGATGRGDGPSAGGLGVPPTALGLYDQATGKSLAEWFNITKNGNMARMMPPWSSRLNDQEIWNTVAYAWTLHTTRAEVETGKALYEANCVACHGADGKGKPPTPGLADFGATAAINQATWAQSLANGKGTMPGFGSKLSANEQRAALAYARTLSFATAFRGPLPKGTGVISGTVTNGTANAPLANYPVELGIFDQTSELETRTTQTDATGFYRFTDLPTDPTLIYAVRVEYAGGFPYGSEPASFAAGQSALDMPVSVFEITDDDDGLRADRVHFIIEFDAERMYVAELVVFSLDGKRAYVGAGMGTLRFILPAAAEGVEISDGELGGRYVPFQSGFVDTMPVPPGVGVRQVLYRYQIPLSGPEIEITRTLPYPTTNINVLVNDLGQQVTSPELTSQGVRQTQNGDYVSLSGQNLPANRVITLRFADLPSGGATAGDSARAGGTDRAVLLVLAGVAGLLAAGLVAWPMMRRGRAPAMAPTSQDRDSLLETLALAEAAHNAGQISDAAYQERRQWVKAQLLDLAAKG